MELEFSRYNFEKYSNIIFNENPSSGSRDVLCLRTYVRTYVRTDGRTKL